MPFRSRKQSRWAFATGQPFARRWAKQTDYGNLKDAGTDAGAQAHGPGGLMATPGMGVGRKWGKRKVRTKAANYSARAGQTIVGNLKRGAGGKFSSAGAASAPVARGMQLSKQPKLTAPKTPTAPKPKGGGKGKGKKGGAAAKPKKTEQQRAAEQAQKKLERQQEHTAQQAKNIEETLSKLNIAKDGQDALEALRKGEQPDPAAIARGGFEQAGLVERADDGSYRMTASGRALLSAAAAGDMGRAGDIISSARDRTSARTTRQNAAAARKQDVAARRAAAAEKKKKAGSSGGSKKQTPKPTANAPRTPAQVAAQVGLSPANVDALRRAAAGESVLTMDVLRPLEVGGLTSDGAITPAGQRALAALERGDVYGFNQAVNEGKKATRTKASDGERLALAHLNQALVIHARHLQRPDEVPSRESAEAEMQHIQAAIAALQATTKASGSPGDYLIVEDPKLSSKWHLQVKTNGKPDHHLMGAAWAALHGGYRGNTYQGPNKQAAIDKLKALYRAEKMELPSEKSFTVFKDASGKQRWILRTSTAFRDRDGEVITTKAQEDDAARMTATGQYGPLRYWHIGQPDPFDPACPWGPGLDLGMCDYSTVLGRTRIESGTFYDDAIGQAIASSADDYEGSPGFFHALDQPDAGQHFTHIRGFERSLVPTQHARASNLFTGLAVGKATKSMDQDTYNKRVAAFLSDMAGKGVAPEVAAGVIAQQQANEKDADEQRIAYKSEEAPSPPEELTINGVTYTLKAAPMMAADEETPEEDMAEGGIEEPGEDGGGDGGDYVGDMSPDAFSTLLTQALTAALAPLVKGLDIAGKMGTHMDELKSMMGGYATKDDARAAEIAALKARLAEIEGNQPTTILPDEVAAALKSKGPEAPPDQSTQPQIPTEPGREWASIAARLMPELYGGQPPHLG